MFKILTLQTGVDQQLQSIAQNYDVEAVTSLGADSAFNQYLLVQYDTKIPLVPAQTSGSSGSADLSAKEKPKSSK